MNNDSVIAEAEFVERLLSVARDAAALPVSDDRWYATRIGTLFAKRISQSHRPETEQTETFAMRALLSILLTVAVAWLVTACNGGGVNNGVVPVPFTSFSVVKSGQPVQANGISQTVSATTTGLGVVTGTNVNAVDTANSMATVTYGSIPAISSFSFTTPGSSVSFSTTNVLCTGGTCSGSNSTTTGTVMNPLTPPTPAWNYQSFGYWLVITSGTTRMAGAISFGSPTPVGAIPVGGTATYSGLSQGTYINQAGVIWTESAQMQSTAN